ncbi:hypothetical protein E2C01_058393 [Portunus trituberculatus]|uniref:Uncharacterized protein n=1 Tax=Portunus trituberculatus TaxID=210409 RepID=A0A5B7GVG1_PORTR|nr:hypothetical protein [Portunus trituberculatus]
MGPRESNFGTVAGLHETVTWRVHEMVAWKETDVRLDDADHLVLPTLLPWRCPATSFNINWLQEKKAVVTEVELHHHFQTLLAGLPLSLHL